MARKATAAQPQTTDNTNRPAAEGETVAGYFRKVFREKPGLLKERSNEELFRRWLEDHPGHTEVPPKVKTGLQNIKAVLRARGEQCSHEASADHIPAEGRPEATAESWPSLSQSV